MVLLSIAKGATTITEAVFEQRFRHVDELQKMGANMTARGRTALVGGVPGLRGALVTGRMYAQCLLS
jgi:UDP-N-acetylglucosamine 1-carboxyvinyltransferase